MALSSECTVKYVLNLLDTADIVRDAMLRQLTIPASLRHHSPHWYALQP